MSDDTYRIETTETETGTFVEIWDSDYSDDEPAAVLPADDAVEMSKAILQRFGIRSVDTGTDRSGGWCS